MSLQTFLDDNGVKDIPPVFVEAFDQVGEQIVRLALLPPIPPSPAAVMPMPIPPLALATPIIAYIVGKTGGSPADAPGLAILLVNIEADINLLIITPLLANATGMNVLPTPVPPVPIPPFTPAALAAPVPSPNALRFGKAILEWAASFILGDPRTGGAITVLALPGA
jgi:hypothetical protein